jgi:calcineurin-like phosphoesterase family protein
MNKIYFTSDLHFCHNQPFLYEPRGFKSIEEMNEAIVAKWNEVVDYEDDVYILGDLMLNDNAVALKYFRRLAGHLHIILGNHDTDARIDEYVKLNNVEEITMAARIKYKGYNFYLSHYPTLCGNYDDDKSLKAKVINLCGHRHTKNKFEDMGKGLIYHVELDAHDCYPVNIDKILMDVFCKVNEI